MKKVLALVTMTLAVPMYAQAAAWNVPTNVRVVQKSNTDTAGRIYGTIQAAITNITNASATNPYVVKVMPGIYNENVTLKPYVTLEGSGAENTIITAVAVPATEGYECTTGTLRMANNSVVKNLTVRRTYTGTSQSSISVNAISVANVSAKIDGVTADASTSYTSHANGICIVGNAGNLELVDSTVMATNNNNGDGQANAVYAAGGALGGASKMTALRSRFTAKNSNSSGDIINFEQTGAYAVLNECVIEDLGATTNASLNSGSGARMLVTNSKVLGLAACRVTSTTESPMIIANSQIDTSNPCSWWGTVKLINNFDTNGNPIPNQ